MTFTTIACLDDLTRQSYWPAKEFIYDLIRVPVFHACGLDLAKSPRNGQRNNLLPGFDHARFLQLCGPAAAQGQWAALYQGLPAAAAEYLAVHLPEGALIVSYEMPVWLRRLLAQTGHTWLDLRISPLRFASDLYVAMGTNCPALYARLHPHAARVDEVFSEASLMAAQVRYHQRYDDRPRAYEGGWVYIGQTEADTSLVNAEGRFERVQDHAATLLTAVADLPLLYKPHPGAGRFAAAEKQVLEQLLGRTIGLCEADTYELLAGERPLGLIGLSSGVLQEAHWFGKSALNLMTPVCQPSFDPEWVEGGFLQIPSHEFLSEPLWASVLTPGERRERPLVHPPRANHLRELHDAWWGYAPHAVRHNELLRHAVALHAPRQAAAPATITGGVPTAEVQRLRDELAQTHARMDTLRLEMDGLKDALRVVLRQTATRALHAAPHEAEAHHG